MSKWIKNIELYFESGKAGKCPECGSDSVVVQEHRYGKRLSLTLSCKDCKSEDHIDGAVPDD